MTSTFGTAGGSVAEPQLTERMRSLIDGYQVSQAISVVATLGIADLLARGPRSDVDLAAAAGAHVPSLYRVMRALAAIGVFDERVGRVFALTPLGECLRSDVPAPMGAMAAYRGRGYYWQAWAGLLHAVRTGENAFLHTHGVNIWEYRSHNPEERAIFDQAMAVNTSGVTDAVLRAFDFSPFSCVVDIGGGQGALLVALLSAYPAMRGILFDQPHNVAPAERILRAASLDKRCEVIGGSFFEGDLPRADALMLKMILHDWTDDDALTILQACRRSISIGGALIVIEQVLGAPNEGAAGKLADLNMLVAVGGEERTLAQFAGLFAAAGFRLESASETERRVTVLLGIPV